MTLQPPSRSVLVSSRLLPVSETHEGVQSAQILKKHPKAACYHNFKDRTSPLIQASGISLGTPSTSLHSTRSPLAARGHIELVAAILECAVMSEGPEKAKRACIDHCNAKHQTALVVACKHG